MTAAIKREYDLPVSGFAKLSEESEEPLDVSECSLDSETSCFEDTFEISESDGSSDSKDSSDTSGMMARRMFGNR